MKYIKEYNEYINESSVFKKTIKELNLNFHFFAIFGTTIPTFFPIFEELVKNQKLNVTLSESDIVLLMICAFAVLFNEHKEKIQKVKDILKERGILKFLKKFISVITDIKRIFKSVAKSFGNIVNTLVDMFSYTALYVPFFLGFLDLIKENPVTLDGFTISGAGFALASGIGVGVITLKHFIQKLLKKISRRKPLNKPIKESVEFIYSDLIIDSI